jgi:uncharacterized protein YjbI with pentapeptide repeats
MQRRLPQQRPEVLPANTWEGWRGQADRRTSHLDYQVGSHTHYTEQVFKELRLEQAELTSSEFYDCTFAHCSFTESVLRRCRFVNCAFQACDLSLVKWPDSWFSGSRFEASKLIGVNWTKAHWPAARLGEPLRFSKCVISHSTFIGLTLRGIHITDCVAHDVDFRETDLSQADFSGTDLSESLFSRTNLTEADLSRACNYHIDPSQNVLKKARFSLPEAMSLLYGLDIVLTGGDS